MKEMYERSYGSKYHTLGGYASAADIAKLMRADIKAEIAAGNLPGSMSNYSVRVESYSMGRSINMEAKGFEGMWEKRMVSSFGYEEEREVLTAEGERIQKILQGIHDAYNYDGSEVQVDYFDVNYYGRAEIESSWRAKFRAREKAAQEAKKAAQAAAPPPEPYRLKPGQDWPSCSKEIGSYRRCGQPATVLQRGKQRYLRQDHFRCDDHKRGACRLIVRVLNPSREGASA